MTESILNPDGLAKSIQNRRAIIQKHFVCGSDFVSWMGRPLGHLFSMEQFKTFLQKCPTSETRREAALIMFEDFARPFGSAGKKVYPLELVDSLLDFLSK